MHMLSHNSLDEIHAQFKNVLQKLGIIMHKQAKLERMLTPEAKMNYIVSLQSQSIKEQNVKFYLEQMDPQRSYDCVSLFHLYSLRATISTDSLALYEIFKLNRGHDILQELLCVLLRFRTKKESMVICNKNTVDSNYINFAMDDKNNYSDTKPGNLADCTIDTRPSYNASQMKFSVFERESLLEEHLNIILIILRNFPISIDDFDFYIIVKYVYLHKVYTKSFYEIFYIYAKNKITSLDFLFESINEKAHLCIINTYFYDIIKDAKLTDEHYRMFWNVADSYSKAEKENNYILLRENYLKRQQILELVDCGTNENKIDNKTHKNVSSDILHENIQDKNTTIIHKENFNGRKINNLTNTDAKKDHNATIYKKSCKFDNGIEENDKNTEYIKNRDIKENYLHNNSNNHAICSIDEKQTFLSSNKSICDKESHKGREENAAETSKSKTTEPNSKNETIQITKLLEFEIIKEFIVNKRFTKIVSYIISHLEFETPYNKIFMENIRIAGDEEINIKTMVDHQSKNTEYKRNVFLQGNGTKTKDYEESKIKIKNKILLLIDLVENEKDLKVLPCFVENFVLCPHIFNNKKKEVELLREVSELRNENLKLKKEISNIEKTNKEVVVIEEKKEVTNVIEKKIEKLTVRKGPPLKKVIKKTVNEHLTPYFKRNYLPLRWEKMSKENNIWDEIYKNYNCFELSRLIPIDELIPFEKKEVKLSSIKKINLKTIFPHKKGNAIGIALGRVKMTDKEFKEKIFKLQDKYFVENTIRQLINNYPSEEEMLLLNEIKKDEKVGRAEEFFMEFKDCYNEFFEILKIIYFKITFTYMRISIRENIKKLSVVYNTGLESHAIKEFFTITLFLGNVFNGDSFNGNAEGYTLESIQKFIEYTGNNKERLIEYIKEKLKHDLKADLKIITGQQNKFELVCTEMTEVNKNFQQMKFYHTKNHNDIINNQNNTNTDNNNGPLNTTINKINEINNNIISKSNEYLREFLLDYETLKDEYECFNALYERFLKFYKGGDVFQSFFMLLRTL
ncbi:hypothetical protein COBT_000051 [Conglomerata obtusa]